MKKQQLLNWIERLVVLRKEFDDAESEAETKALLAHLLGYIESGEFIIKFEKGEIPEK